MKLYVAPGERARAPASPSRRCAFWFAATVALLRPEAKAVVQQGAAARRGRGGAPGASRHDKTPPLPGTTFRELRRRRGRGAEDALLGAGTRAFVHAWAFCTLGLRAPPRLAATRRDAWNGDATSAQRAEDERVWRRLRSLRWPLSPRGESCCACWSASSLSVLPTLAAEAPLRALQTLPHAHRVFPVLAALAVRLARAPRDALCLRS